MDVGLTILLLVVFGVIGYLSSLIIGINIYTLFCSIGIIGFFGPLVILMFYATINPEAAIYKLGDVLVLTFSNLPSIIIGDIAGIFIGLITRSKR